MPYPSFMEISLYIAMIAIVLVLTTQFLYSYRGEYYIILERSRFKSISFVVGITFVLVVLVEILNVARM